MNVLINMATAIVGLHAPRRFVVGLHALPRSGADPGNDRIEMDSRN
jgi:hypothetical protein